MDAKWKTYIWYHQWQGQLLVLLLLLLLLLNRAHRGTNVRMRVWFNHHIIIIIIIIITIITVEHVWVWMFSFSLGRRISRAFDFAVSHHLQSSANSSSPVDVLTRFPIATDTFEELEAPLDAAVPEVVAKHFPALQSDSLRGAGAVKRTREDAVGLLVLRRKLKFKE
uniref:Uncharacterized protein n=1 Tax=Anopheles coluzzii TaxID=1518534 RepID=A0A8W7PND0_ANOCL